MNTVKILPNSVHRIRFSPFEDNRTGMLDLAAIRTREYVVGDIHVSSDASLTVYVMDTDGLNEYMGQADFTYIHKSGPAFVHDFQIKPIYKTWYLVIINDHNNKAPEVQYDFAVKTLKRRDPF
jgi:hypothetical protein